MSGSNRFRRHVVALLVKADVAGTRKEVQESVRRWAEHHGHTTSDFGFDIVDAGRVVVKFSGAAKPSPGEMADEEDAE